MSKPSSLRIKSIVVARNGSTKNGSGATIGRGYCRHGRYDHHGR